MSCEINDNPCDECEERYCPDQLMEVRTKFYDLVASKEHYTKVVDNITDELAKFADEHSDVLDTSILSHRTLEQSAKLARGDMAMCMKYTPKELHWRPLQSIRMITEDLEDQEYFRKIWDRWVNDEDLVYLPSFDEMMTKK